MQYFAGVSGRDEVVANIETKDSLILSSSLKAIGCLPFLHLVDEYRGKIKGEVQNLTPPSSHDHAGLIMRELILKIKGEWDFPYKEVELCHCRAIACEKVDAAILYGAQSAEAVARATSAGTGCGTCRPHTEKIIKYRLG